ncbi:MAG: hypothetical protein WD266_06335 [Balneolales bacterium]
MKELPSLHEQAKMFKNRKRLQHDGGRAWIKDGQLHEAIRGTNYRLVTLKPSSLENAGRQVLEKQAGLVAGDTDTGKTV